MSSFGFIGAGNMGGAIAQALCRGFEPQNVSVYNRHMEKSLALAEGCGCIAANSAEQVIENAHFVFIGVKPHMFRDVFSNLLPILKAYAQRGDTKVICSMVTGITTQVMDEMLFAAGIELPVIRIMPNTPVAVGKGLTLMCCNERVSKEDKELFIKAMECGGMVMPIAENALDSATPVFGCSPAFVYMFIEALADGGVMSGVPRKDAQTYAAQAVLGAAAMVLETGKHPGELKDNVCSPGGSTIVGVETLEKHGFRGAVSEAVYEAYKKTLLLGK